MVDGAGTTGVASLSPRSRASRHPFRDAIIGASVAVLLSLGLIGELSGARDPDYPLAPGAAEQLRTIEASGDCAGIELSLDWPVGELSIRRRAYIDELEAIRHRLGCPSD